MYLAEAEIGETATAPAKPGAFETIATSLIKGAADIYTAKMGMKKKPADTSAQQQAALLAQQRLLMAQQQPSGVGVGTVLAIVGVGVVGLGVVVWMMMQKKANGRN